ncbi:MAG TPA: protein kinase [Terriglobales bacterium]|jgi:serine/threonine protein kinase|nr:protein kinase [Terriglobales bacterium]
MNDRIKRLIKEWQGKTLNGWLIGEYVNSGKSALVFKSIRGNTTAAIKVFDPELIERFGKESEEDRISRELTLVGKHHPNLVQIFDGGYCAEHDLFFVVMEFIDAPNLAMLLKDVPESQIADLIGQVATAAEYLEQLGIVHRDIKPDNIAFYPETGRAVLLDLGVIRPFERDGQPLTDREKQVFIGTLQYGSPEFLMRMEEQTPEGYRAVTFYQLGAVLHDLLMRRRIFEGSTDPYPKLVQAILYTRPLIDAQGRPPYLVNLAQNCLVKEWRVRLQLVSWKDFRRRETDINAAAAAKEFIKKRRALAAVEAAEAGDGDWEKIHKQEQAVTALAGRLAEQVRAECTEGELPPRIMTHEENEKSSQLIFRFKKSIRRGLLVNLTVILELDVLDFDAEVVGIKIAALAGGEREQELRYKEHVFAIFSGVYGDSVIRDALAKVLYPIMAKAMTLASTAASEWIAVTTNDEGSKK